MLGRPAYCIYFLCNLLGEGIEWEKLVCKKLYKQVLGISKKPRHNAVEILRADKQQLNCLFCDLYLIAK